MKARARMVVWWPGLDKSIEEIVSNCSACQASRPLPLPAPLHPWSIPQKAWFRLHMDYAGPLHDHMFLIVVDAFSKWLEIVPVKNSTSSVTIDKLRGICSTHGLPDTIVTDNAAVFTTVLLKGNVTLVACRVLVARSHSTRAFKLATRKSLYTWFTTITFMRQSYLT